MAQIFFAAVPEWRCSAIASSRRLRSTWEKSPTCLCFSVASMSPRRIAARHCSRDQSGAAACAALSELTRPSMQPESQESPPPISSRTSCVIPVSRVDTISPVLRHVIDHLNCTGGIPGSRNGSRCLQQTAMAHLWPRRACIAASARRAATSSAGAPGMPLGTSVSTNILAASGMSKSSPSLSKSPMESTRRSRVPTCGSTMTQRSSKVPRAGL
mmetsp:Transcript_66692/g.168212  ORF Transcript_66692/g.168212 Transcript_66692/m.168212 type:complete len:214 (-) Transcript_66692:852-1493(-)